MKIIRKIIMVSLQKRRNIYTFFYEMVEIVNAL